MEIYIYLAQYAGHSLQCTYQSTKRCLGDFHNTCFNVNSMFASFSLIHSAIPIDSFTFRLLSGFALMRYSYDYNL